MVWDVLTGKRRTDPMRHDGWPFGLAVSHDDRLLATGATDNKLRLWDLSTGRPACEPLTHPDWVFNVSFSPDDRLVLTSCRDNMARLWDWRARKLVCPPFKHDDEVFGVAFIPDGHDGHFVLTASRDSTARAWEWQTGKPVIPPIPLHGWAYSIAVSADGRHAAVAVDWPHTALVLGLGDLTEPCDLSLDDLCLVCEIVSGFRVKEAGIEGLTTEQWFEQWKDFRQRHPRDVEMATSADFAGIASWMSSSGHRGDGAKP